MEEKDILQEIPEIDLINLRSLYQQHERMYPQVFSLLDISIQWMQKKPESKYLTFYGINGDWLTSGTFILLMQFHCYDLFVFSLEEDSKGLHRALAQTKKIDWTKRLMFYSVSSKHTFTVISALQEIRVPSFLCVDTELWVIEKEKALEFEIECPDDVYIGPLNTAHAELINAHWPHGHEGAEKYLGTFIEMNKSFGVFLKSDDSLVAWIIKSPMGQMKSLHTIPEHRRKGYAVLLTKIMSKEIAQGGHDALGTIVRRNTASENMFRRLGFRSIDICSYIIINTE